MSFLNDIADSLAPHLPLALAAVSLLFALGGIALVLVRSPAHRQRIGELTLAAALGWLVLAAIPLPRWLPVGDDAKSADPIPLNSSTTAIQPRWLETARRAHQRDAGISPIRGSSFETSANSRHGEPIDPMLAQHNSDAPAPISSAQPVSQDAAIAVERPSGPLADSATTQIDFQAHDSILAGSDAVSRDTAIATKLQASQPRRDLQWLSVAAFAYLIGVALATIWLLLGHGLLMRERFTAAAPAAWLYRLSHNAVSQWEGRLPRLVVSRRASRPLSWGVWRPIICLPDRICHTANRDQLRPILLHELGHI
ncbi:MAG TPA: M56 family metallopeptidase, partial [Pirellulales bacterium]|nr:M56 family metallopeptidase [Pirellulales bacterium]